jgi:hypothetical protein
MSTIVAEQHEVSPHPRHPDSQAKWIDCHAFRNPSRDWLRTLRRAGVVAVRLSDGQELLIVDALREYGRLRGDKDNG